MKLKKGGGEAAEGRVAEGERGPEEGEGALGRSGHAEDLHRPRHAV